MATQEQIKSIINRIAPFAQKYAQKYGYHVCSPCIAQALQESLGKYEGLSYLAYKYNNFHGIKAYPKWTGRTVNMQTGEEYSKGTITSVSSNFCVFDNEEDAFEQYFLFLERNKRYSNLKSCRTPEFYLQTIKNDGYCTSSTYVSNCISKINAYNLKEYDNFNYIEPATKVDYYIKGKSYTLQANMYIRISPQGDKIDYYSITSNAQLNAYTDDEGYSVLRAGTRVTCKDYKTISDEVWMQIPSGWCCARKADKIYIA